MVAIGDMRGSLFCSESYHQKAFQTDGTRWFQICRLFNVSLWWQFFSFLACAMCSCSCRLNEYIYIYYIYKHHNLPFPIWNKMENGIYHEYVLEQLQRNLFNNSIFKETWTLPAQPCEVFQQNILGPRKRQWFWSNGWINYRRHISDENLQNLLFQGSIFGCHVSFRGCTGNIYGGFLLRVYKTNWPLEATSFGQVPFEFFTINSGALKTQNKLP